MDVGICFPYMERDLSRDVALAWFRAVDEGPFSSLSCGERITGYTVEMVTTLGAAAAVTERVRIVPTLYVLPMHSAVRAAKEIATLRKRVNDLALGGRDLRPELVSLEIEDIVVWNYSNAFVTTIEVWNLRIFASGTTTVLSEVMAQRNRVKYQIKRREVGWQVLYRTLDSTFE